MTSSLAHRLSYRKGFLMKDTGILQHPLRLILPGKWSEPLIMITGSPGLVMLNFVQSSNPFMPGMS